VRHPFYRDHWKGFFDSGDAALAEADALQLLVELPALTRQDLKLRLAPFLDEDDELTGVGFSSGSSGEVVCRYMCAKEQKYLGFMARAPRAPGQNLPTVRVDFVTTWHGLYNDNPSGSIRLPGAAFNDSRIRRTIDLLRMEFYVGNGVRSRASVVTGGLLSVHTLTRYLVDNAIPSSDFGVRVVGTYGGYLGERRRRWMADYWKAPIVNNFSVSECRGKGLVCPNCGYIDFDPQLVPQLLELDSTRCQSGGIGQLALTELYPFGIAQPIVKYLTNDVVERLDAETACSPAHVGGLRRAGRIGTSLIANVNGRRTLLLSSQELYEAFDRDGVCRADPYHGLSGIANNDIEQPYVAAALDTDGRGRHTIRIRFRPDLHGAHDAAQQAERSLTRIARVSDLIANHDMRLEITACESLEVPPPKYA
jgi:phenylacetate-coenzyme A ligase PaaK-like adenylate-forming protein